MQLYKISFKRTDKCYIGITSKTAEERFNQHCSNNKKFAINNAIKKYGKENAILTVIGECDDLELLCLAEIEAIEKYNSKFPNGYNLTDGGEGTNGYEYTEEQKKENSVRLKKYYENEENRINNSNRQKIAHGTDEMKAKQSIKMKEYYDNEENRKKMSDISKEFMSREGEIEKRSKQTSDYFKNNPDACQRVSDQMTEHFKNPENRKAQSERVKLFNKNNPDHRKKVGEIRRKNKADKLLLINDGVI